MSNVKRRKVELTTCSNSLSGEQNSDDGLAEGSKGFSLLKKAGFTGKTLGDVGLGKQEDGIKSPIKPWLNVARSGIGFASNAANDKTRSNADQRNQSKQKKAEREKAEREKAEASKAATIRQKQQVEEEEHKAISRYIRRAFNDNEDCADGMSPTSHHPLLGGNRLSALNPLLDDDDD